MTTTDKTKPAHRQIADEIRRHIAEDHYPDGKLPSERALIRQYGVNRTTVVKALQNLESEGLIVKRRGSGSFVNAATSARPRYVSTLVAGTAPAGAFLSEICAAIARTARAQRINLVWGLENAFNRLDFAASLLHYVQRCREDSISGVFLIPEEDASGDGSATHRNEAIVSALTRSGIHVVLLDRDIVKYPLRSALDLVGIDNIRTGYDQADFLIGLGCRKLAYVSHPRSVWTVEARTIGFQRAIEAAAAHGVASVGLFRGEAEDPSFVRHVLSKRPDGIVFVHDDVMGSFVNHTDPLKRKRLRCIGTDDLPISSFLKLPTMRQPAAFIGEEAARIMAQRLNHDTMLPRQVLFSTELIPRGCPSQVR